MENRISDKTEMKTWCVLTRRQAGLYGEAVEELKRAVKTTDGIQRRGLVLSFLMRFKQICNHPAQLSGDGDWDGAASGKFLRLGELCDEIASRQEKVLIFTQFREMTNDDPPTNPFTNIRLTHSPSPPLNLKSSVD